MLWSAMKVPALRFLAGLALTAASLAACWREFPTLRELAGLPKVDDPSVDIKPAEPKWLLIKNPRFGDVASEPEYIWVEEDKIPTTMGTLVFGKGSLIASPEIVAKYGSPPRGGRISPRPKMAVSRAPQPPAAQPGAAGQAGGAPGRRTACPASRSRLRRVRGHEPGGDRPQQQGRDQARCPGQRAPGQDRHRPSGDGRAARRAR